jgi:hypothetical protein
VLKVTKTTDNRTLDEDLRRLYQRGDEQDAAIAALKKASSGSTATTTTQVVSLPPIIPPSPGVTVNPVEASSVVGILSSFSPSDHAHEGLHSIAAFGQAQITGDATVQAGTGIVLAQSASNIVINAIFGTVAPTVVLPAASPYTVGGGDITIFADTTTGPISIVLVGGAINTGRFVWINNIGTGANNVTVSATSGGVLNITTIAPSGGVLYNSTGANWRSIQNSIGN